MIEINTTSNGQIHIMCILRGTQYHFYRVVTAMLKHQTGINEGHSIKLMAFTLQNFQDHEKQRQEFQIKGDQQDMTTKFN